MIDPNEIAGVVSIVITKDFQVITVVDENVGSKENLRAILNAALRGLDAEDERTGEPTTATANDTADTRTGSTAGES